MLTLKGRPMKMTIRVAIGTLCSLTLLANTERALAHGDTIRLSYARVQPERLVVVAGTTVHFHNANQSGAPCISTSGSHRMARRSFSLRQGTQRAS